MMETEDALALSYIAQYGYCPRRAALLMNQQLWNENEYTAEGRLQHSRAHEHRVERRGDTLYFYEFPVWSQSLHLSGKCDRVEAYADAEGAPLPDESGRFRLYPVEYKHGSVRDEPEYEQQLCAQALCLEEMYHTAIASGALFYIESHRRIEVPFTPELRRATRQTAEALWQLWQTQALPAASKSPRCSKCSMKEACLPDLTRTAASYRKRLFQELQEVKL